MGEAGGTFELFTRILMKYRFLVRLRQNEVHLGLRLGDVLVSRGGAFVRARSFVIRHANDRTAFGKRLSPQLRLVRDVQGIAR